MQGTNGQTKDWLTATQKGDLSWFDQFYLDNKGSFLQWASSEFALPGEEILDVYQHAVVIFYENLVDNKLNQLTSSLKTYLFGIGKNLLLKRVNKVKIEHRHLEKVREHWIYQDMEIPDNAWLISKVKSELQSMKEPCQTILKFYYLDNLSLEIIAELLDYSTTDVVKTQKSRCLKNLRTKLSEWWNSQNN